MGLRKTAVIWCIGLANALAIAQTPPSPLIEQVFADLPAEMAPTLNRDRSPFRRRNAIIDAGALFGRAAGLDANAERSLRFNLFDDRIIDVNFDANNLGVADAPIWFGRFADDPDGYAIFVKYEDAIVGRVVSPDFGTIEVISAQGGIADIAEMDTRAAKPCGVDHRHVVPAPEQPDGQPGEHTNATRGIETGTLIHADVLTAYTNAAATDIGGTSAMIAWINSVIAETNLYYFNSQIDLRVRNAGTVAVNYVAHSFDMSVDLVRLRETDGIMDEVHALRNQVGADLVHLIVPIPTNACGVAWVMSPTGSYFDIWAFGVTARGLCGQFVFAHELGHNMGCQHDRSNAGNTPSHPFAYGYRTPNTAFRTVMAYLPGNLAPYFSNPNVTYQGFPMGVPQGQPNPCDNARAINLNASTIAAWRPSAAPPPGPFALTSPALGASNVPRPTSLQWAVSADALSYRVLVDNDSNMSSPVVDVGEITSPSYQVPASLLQGNTIYFWSVRASNSGGVRDSSPVTSWFRTAVAPPGAPGPFSLSFPPDGAILGDAWPTLSWSASPAAQSYSVKIDDDPEFTSPTYSVTTGFTSVVVPPGILAYKRYYYWSVIAMNTTDSTGSTPQSRVFRTGHCPGDANYDRVVNFADITNVLEFWGTNFTDGHSGEGDTNDDDTVSFADITKVLEQWGAECF